MTRKEHQEKAQDAALRAAHWQKRGNQGWAWHWRRIAERHHAWANR